MTIQDIKEGFRFYDPITSRMPSRVGNRISNAKQSWQSEQPKGE